MYKGIGFLHENYQQQAYNTLNTTMQRLCELTNRFNY